MTPQQVLQAMDKKFNCLAKDKDGTVAAFSSIPFIEDALLSTPCEWVQTSGEYLILPSSINIEWQSDDWTQCLVEREETPDNDGWIEFDGNSCPKELLKQYVFITRKCGTVDVGFGKVFIWESVSAYKVIPTPEPYQPPKPDYSKWVGCLCHFWDDDETFKKVGILADFSNDKFKFHMENSFSWRHCRPVRPDEIKFVKE